MNPSLRRTTGTTAAVACLLLTAACGGNGPVTSKVPLSKLGPPVVTNGQDLVSKAATAFQTTSRSIRPGTHNLRCAGGQQRRYAAKITAAVPAADTKNIDTVLEKLARGTLDPSGYHLMTKVSSSAPPKLLFQTKPSSPGARRTVITDVKKSGRDFTWVVRAHTACIKKS